MTFWNTTWEAAQATWETAQTTWETAQTTRETAQTTWETAQTTWETARTTWVAETPPANGRRARRLAVAISRLNWEIRV